MFQVLLIAFAVCASVDSNVPHESQLLKIARARSEIASGEIVLRVRFSDFKLIPNIVGGEWNIHYWFQSDRSVVRLDESRGKDEADGSPSAFRYAFDGKTYRMVDRVDDPSVVIREYARTKPRTAPSLIDARLLGIFPSTFLALHNYSLLDVERIVVNAITWSHEAARDGFSEMYKHNNSLICKYYYAQNGLLDRIITDEGGMGHPIHCETRIGYDRMQQQGHFFFPSKIDFKRYESGKLAIHEEVEIRVVQFNQPIDRSICTWEALAPPVGAPIMRDSDFLHIREKWNGKGFVPFTPRAGVVRAGAGGGTGPLASRKRSVAFVLLLSNSVFLGAVLAYRVLHRSSGREEAGG